ncbi:MAG: signal peptidase I [Ruminococcus sp.]|nr:signal peptidase I [Ruminococcus sp.]
MNKLKKVFNILGTILLVILIAVVIVMFNARLSGEAPSVFGYQIFRVSSGSMEPELMIGDVILVREADVEDIHKGDIVTYKGEVDDFADKFITHKMIEEPQLVDGKYVFESQGIVEGALPDPLWYEDQLMGEFVCKVPFIDSVYTFFLQPYGLIVFILVIVVLFGYELISLIVSYKTLDELEYAENNSEKENNNNKSTEELASEDDDNQNE